MVQKGDLIVLSSDGMFDVMTDSTILKVVNKNIDKDLQTIADELLLQSMRCNSFFIYLSKIFQIEPCSFKRIFTLNETIF